MRRRRRFLADQGAAVAVEFAFVAAPMLMLGFGIYYFGSLMWTYEGLQDAALAGARCVGLSATNCAANGVYSATSSASYIQSEAQKWSITLPANDIAINRSATCGGVSNFSQVTISYVYQPAMPEISNFLNASQTLTAVACFPTASG